MSKEFLSAEEKSRIIAFNSDDSMREAVKKVLLYNIYNCETLQEGKPAGLDKNWAYGCDIDGKASDEEVGKRLRVRISALSFLEDAFKELGNYRVEVKGDEDENPAL